MNLPLFIRPGSILLYCLVICFAGCRAPESQTRSGVHSKPSAPTGVYVSVTPVARFTVRLETDGSYQVRAESSLAGTSRSEEGRWTWNSAIREFILTPIAAKTGDGFDFEFRRLRVDQQAPDSLQWIPLHYGGPAAGAIDYVRLKRE